MSLYSELSDVADEVMGEFKQGVGAKPKGWAWLEPVAALQRSAGSPFVR